MTAEAAESEQEGSLTAARERATRPWPQLRGKLAAVPPRVESATAVVVRGNLARFKKQE